jgi:hypothetical protein
VENEINTKSNNVILKIIPFAALKAQIVMKTGRKLLVTHGVIPPDIIKIPEDSSAQGTPFYTRVVVRPFYGGSARWMFSRYCPFNI